MDRETIGIFESCNQQWASRARRYSLSRIGISVEPTWRPAEPTDSVSQMADALLDAGGLPCLLSPGFPLAGDPLADIDGLVLPGGNDLDPATYGQKPEGTHMDEVKPDFDQFELGLARRVLDLNMPFLGSCRGALVLNVAAGGTLFQDLQPGSRFTHRGRGARLHTALDHTCIKHPSQPIFVSPGSRLYDIVGGVAAVNSFHHQAIDQLAPIFSPVAHSEDAILEAFQRKSTPVQAGYQFHPEKQRLDDPRFDMLFQHLVRDGGIYRSRMARTG